ncbi:MAG: AmmeMemoRadiSam system radical SAM enzyme [Chlorobi bacterium]|nr:AmmeMemoRadiSam system radical SAM enzyme [Chlorobiota bacterium]
MNNSGHPVIDKFFDRLPGGKIRCKLCSHYCTLREGQTGVCGVNKNEKGRLVNLVYGKIAAIHVDPIEKKPLYHFLPGSRALSIGTVGCNMKCSFCQNWQISQVRKVEQQDYVPPEQLVALALRYDSRSIAYTYNEPTIFYPYARDVSQAGKRYGLRNVFVTNGIETPEVIEDMKDHIDAANVDYKADDEKYYKRELKAPFTVRETIVHMKKVGMWVEVTTLIIPGINDDPEHLKRIATFIADKAGTETPWHISAFHPDYKMTDRPPTPLTTLEQAAEIGRKAGLKFIYIGNVGKRNITYCPNCGAPLIERVGYIILANRLKDGKCYQCNTKIPGIWN